MRVRAFGSLVFGLVSVIFAMTAVLVVVLRSTRKDAVFHLLRQFPEASKTVSSYTIDDYPPHDLKQRTHVIVKQRRVSNSDLVTQLKVLLGEHGFSPIRGEVTDQTITYLFASENQRVTVLLTSNGWENTFVYTITYWSTVSPLIQQ
jgi:hypothetical protein